MATPSYGLVSLPSVASDVDLGRESQHELLEKDLGSEMGHDKDKDISTFLQKALGDRKTEAPLSSSTTPRNRGRQSHEEICHGRKNLSLT